jgi:ubiquinone/menaquinone biosynthesis C-methylase UbiE
MLDVGRAKPEIAGAAPIEYVESPAAPLVAPSGTFDAVLCSRGYVPDEDDEEIVRVPLTFTTA